MAIQIAAASWPVTSRLLGEAVIPVELWGVVFGGSLIVWSLSEVISRYVWRETRGHRI
jgi:hypothetical protein